MKKDHELTDTLEIAKHGAAMPRDTDRMADTAAMKDRADMGATTKPTTGLKPRSGY